MWRKSFVRPAIRGGIVTAGPVSTACHIIRFRNLTKGGRCMNVIIISRDYEIEILELLKKIGKDKLIVFN